MADKNKSGLAPIIVVGMARSGTTITTHVLGNMPDVHMEVEPHALWKSGNFKYLNDEEYDLKPGNIEYIRNAMLDAAGNNRLIEKSPPNCIRPQLVHAVFPDAKLVYIERDAVKCISSNLKRSEANDSFKPSIVLKKYFVETGSEALAGAVGKRSLFEQIRISDLFYFIRYVLGMLWIRQVKNLLPFGTKLKGFSQIVKEKGHLQYLISVFRKAESLKPVFKELYGENMASFKLEKIMQDPNEIKRMFDFVDYEYTDKTISDIISTFNADTIKKALSLTEKEMEIKEALEKTTVA